MGVAIAVMCHKGGTAKTTTVQSLSGYFAGLGKKVLIIDTDEQSNVKTIFGLKLSEAEGGMAAILMKGLRPEAMVHKTQFENIDVIMSGGRYMKQFEEDIKVDRPDRFLLMKRMCESLKEMYDIILVDTPPALSLISSNVVGFSDYVILTSEPDMLSSVGARSTVDFIIDVMGKQFNIPTPEILGLVLTRFDQRRRADIDVYDALDTYVNNGGLRGGVLFTPVRSDAKIRTAQVRRKHIFAYAPDSSKAAEDYAKMGERILAMIQKPVTAKDYVTQGAEASV